MPNQKYGITFPFTDSNEGFFLGLNSTTDAEVKSSLVHLILTLKGTRYFLPDFGTNLMKYIYEPMDTTTRVGINNEIKDAVEKFMPNLVINDIDIKTAEDVRLEEKNDTSENINDNSFGFIGEDEREYTMRIRIDYSAGDGFFETKDFVIINL
jgi:phage baseplate assembly protein W|tara:strand:+ start:376 stop:834 length:459 start_codon:yes stop_codon:yes gene_type:complete